MVSPLHGYAGTPAAKAAAKPDAPAGTVSMVAVVRAFEQLRVELSGLRGELADIKALLVGLSVEPKAGG